MRLRTVVVDDEQLAREELCFLLERAGGVEILGQASNGVDGLRLVGEHRPDLLLLDVQMPGLNGFEVAHRLMDASLLPNLVFVTAYDQYALDAFKVNAVDYLLKPVDADRLEETLERVRRRVDADQRAQATLDREDVERLLRAMAERPAKSPAHDQLAIKADERFMLVTAGEIIHASMVDESIVVVTNTVSGTSNYRTLDELSARLDPSMFWRVHRSHLVNITQIKEIVPWFSRNYILRMRDPKATEIPVSRAQTRRLREHLKL
jgi:DNA-binding LytR/AlgR family response regulator